MNNCVYSRDWFRLLVVFVLCFIAIAPSVSWLLDGSVPASWLREDGLYESAGAVSCFIAGLLMFGGFRLAFAQKQCLYGVWLSLFSIGCLFIAGEEVSWGQGYFGYGVPDSVLAANFQNEFNLHNSKLIQSSNNDLSSILFKLLMLYFILLPMFVVAFKIFEKAVHYMMIPVPSMLIAIIVLLAKMADILNYKVIYGAAFVKDKLRLGEGVESLIEICLLILAIECYVKLKEAGSKVVLKKPKSADPLVKS